LDWVVSMKNFKNFWILVNASSVTILWILSGDLFILFLSFEKILMNGCSVTFSLYFGLSLNLSQEGWCLSWWDWLPYNFCWCYCNECLGWSWYWPFLFFQRDDPYYNGVPFCWNSTLAKLQSQTVWHQSYFYFDQVSFQDLPYWYRLSWESVFWNTEEMLWSNPVILWGWIKINCRSICSYFWN